MGCYPNGQYSCMHPLCEDCNPGVNRVEKSERQEVRLTKVLAHEKVSDKLKKLLDSVEIAHQELEDAEAKLTEVTKPWKGDYTVREAAEHRNECEANYKKYKSRLDEVVALIDKYIFE